MTISPLADLPDAIETLAQWFYDEWHAFDGRRMENIATQLSENLNRDFMPITFVAHRNRLRLAPSLLTVSTSRRLIISHRGSALCMFIPPFAARASEAVLFATSSTLPSHMELVLSRFCPLGGRGVNGRAEASDRPGQSGRNFALGRKSCRYVGVALRFPGLGFGPSRRGIEPQEMKLPAVEQFPLNFITRLQPDGDGQGQREAHIQAGILSARTDRLNSQRISGLHFF